MNEKLSGKFIKGVFLKWVKNEQHQLDAAAGSYYIRSLWVVCSERVATCCLNVLQHQLQHSKTTNTQTTSERQQR